MTDVHDTKVAPAVIEPVAELALPPPADPLGDARREFAEQLV